MLVLMYTPLHRKVGEAKNIREIDYRWIVDTSKNVYCISTDCRS